MKKIMQDIKENNFESFYLLYGSEDYLKHQYRDKLIKALVDAEDNMNYSYFEGKKINVSEMLDIGDTLPFFADNRVIVVENSGLFKKTPEGFEKRLENFPDSTHVIFVESEVDGRNRLNNWFKKNGYKTEMKPPTEGELRKWIAKLCKDENKQIYENAVEYFIGAVGLDMLLIKNELEKLFAYVGERGEITVDDVRAICVNEADDTLYAMIDAIGNRNQKEALLLYRNLLELKQEPLFILSQLSRNVRKMLEVSELIKSGKSSDEIASAAGIPKWTINRYKSQIRHNGKESFIHMLEKCLETEANIKTGLVKDIVGVELLIVEFSAAG